MALFASVSKVRIPSLRDVVLAFVVVFLAIVYGLPRVGVLAHEGSDALSPAVALGNAFTYQGKLEESGIGANTPHDFEFALFDAESGAGSALQTLPVLQDVPVNNGLFSVTLNFNAVQFAGQERWLEVKVRPGTSTGSFETLGRQQLTATPYALYAKAVGAHSHFGDTWTGSSQFAALTVKNVNTTTGLAIEARTSAPFNPAIFAANDYNGACGTGFECIGIFGSGVNKGVFGSALNFGVFGEAFAGGTGVQGEGLVGVRGVADDPNGVGVRGDALTGNGVVGTSTGAGYAAVAGSNAAGFGVRGTGNIGVEGAGGTGVRGETTAINGAGVTGDGKDLGNGVIALSSAIGYAASFGQNNSGIGVYGVGDIGIQGVADAPGNLAAKFDGAVQVNGLLDGSGSTVVTTNLRPDLSLTRDLGAASHPWRTVYYDFLVDQSDARLKKDVAALAPGLADILALRPMSYRMKAGDGSLQFGLIAQDVQTVLPDLVKTGDDDQQLLGVDYVQLIPVLIRAIQEQQAEIEALERRCVGP